MAGISHGGVCSLADLSAFINSLSDPIFVKDSSHRHVLVNDAYCRVTGITREQLLGTAGEGIFPEQQIRDMAASDDRVLKTGRPDTREIELKKRPSGELLVLEIVKTLFTDRDGQKLIVGIFRDIAARKSAAEAMRQSERNYREIFNATSDALFVHGESGRILDVNDRMCELFG